MSAAKAVQIMLYRRIVLLICSLNAAFRHHRIGITDTELCYDHNISACIVRFDGAGGTGSAASDHQYVYVIVNLCNINILICDTACGVEHLGQFKRRFLSLVRSYLDLRKRIWIIIWMEFLQESIFFIRSQTSRLCRHTLCSRSLYLFDGFHHILWIWCIHMFCPPLLFNLSVVVKFLHLRDRLLHDLLDQLIIPAFIDLLYTVCKMLCLRRDVFSCKPPCQNTYMWMRDSRRASYGTAAASDTVKGFLCTFLKLTALCICNILHYVQILCAGLCTGITSDTAVDLRIQLHHDPLVSLNFLNIIGSLVCREKWDACHIHALFYLCLAGKAGL